MYKVDCYAQDIVIISALVNLPCASTTMYKVDCYAQNIVITAALVNLQCACYLWPYTAHVLLMMGGIATRNM